MSATNQRKTAKSEKTPLETAKRVLQIEADAIAGLIGRLDERFEKAVELLFACKGRVVVTGLGKSGLIGRKIAATFASTGTPSFFLHAGEALHGDLGMLAAGDVLLAISASGETDELIELLESLKPLGILVLTLTARPDSTLATASDDRSRHLRKGRSVLAESCADGLHSGGARDGRRAGDFVARAARIQGRGFCGAASRRTAGQEAAPRRKRSCALARPFRACCPGTKMPDVIYEMSRKGLGLTAVTESDGRLLGIITDGDLRRMMQERKENVLDLTADDCMTRTPVTVSRTELAPSALRLMEERKITSRAGRGRRRAPRRRASSPRSFGAATVLMGPSRAGLVRSYDEPRRRSSSSRTEASQSVEDPKMPIRELKFPAPVMRRARNIRVLLMDVDGTMTPGVVCLQGFPDGSVVEMKVFNAHDGAGIKLASIMGIRTGLITGRDSPATTRRAREASMEFVIQGQPKKLEVVQSDSRPRGRDRRGSRLRGRRSARPAAAGARRIGGGGGRRRLRSEARRALHHGRKRRRRRHPRSGRTDPEIARQMEEGDSTSHRVALRERDRLIWLRRRMAFQEGANVWERRGDGAAGMDLVHRRMGKLPGTARLVANHDPTAAMAFEEIRNQHRRSTLFQAELGISLRLIPVDGDIANVHFHGGHVDALIVVKMFMDGFGDRVSVTSRGRRRQERGGRIDGGAGRRGGAGG